VRYLTTQQLGATLHHFSDYCDRFPHTPTGWMRLTHPNIPPNTQYGYAEFLLCVCMYEVSQFTVILWLQECSGSDSRYVVLSYRYRLLNSTHTFSIVHVVIIYLHVCVWVREGGEVREDRGKLCSSAW